MDLLKDRIAEVGVDTQGFLNAFNVMRFQAVAGTTAPYEEVLRSSMDESMRRHGLRHQDSDGDAIDSFALAGVTYVLALDTRRAMTMLLIACPCAAGLATPPRSVPPSATAPPRHPHQRRHPLEDIGRVTVVVFDKTGTLTLGRPRSPAWSRPARRSPPTRC